MSGVRAMELIEDRRQLVVQDPDSGVLDLDLEPSIRYPNADVDRSLVRVLDRVAEQVEKDLAQLAPVGHDGGQVAGGSDAEPDLRAVDKWLEGPDDFVDQLGDVCLLELDPRLSGFDPRELEDLVDQSEQTLRAE